MAAPVLSSFADLASAARAIMSYLQEQLGLGLWMFTRVEGDAWIVLDTLGAGYTVRWLLGIHPVEDVPADAKSDAFDASDFETRIERSRRAQRSA